MRWTPKSPASSQKMPWWGWALSPLWMPPMALVALIAGTLVGALWLKRWLMGPTEKWRPWFAWFPVTTSPWPHEERAWLEWVERRAGHLMGDATYRTEGAGRAALAERGGADPSPNSPEAQEAADHE